MISDLFTKLDIAIQNGDIRMFCDLERQIALNFRPDARNMTEAERAMPLEVRIRLYNGRVICTEKFSALPR